MKEVIIYRIIVVATAVVILLWLYEMLGRAGYL